MMRLVLAGLLPLAWACSNDTECDSGKKCCGPLDGTWDPEGQCYDPTNETCASCGNTFSLICPHSKASCCHTTPAAPGAVCYDKATEDCTACGLGINKACPGPGGLCCLDDGCYKEGDGECCWNHCGGSGANFCKGNGSTCCGGCGACASSDNHEKCCSDAKEPYNKAWACPEAMPCGNWSFQCK
eukprot:Hpha_TRINITY_DN6069_c0_g1::TRINITY_DN6069_c0_g1_i1::g.63403::m.63403